MCGRFTLTASQSEIATAFALADVPPLEPRYNIAPTQAIATVMQTAPQAERVFRWLRWGLIPSWAKDPSIGNRLINARAETVHEKPSFRSAFRQRRCLIMADGFYEWQRQPKGKQPSYFRLTEQQPFAFAGLWEQWQPEGAEAITSCTLLTTVANDCLRPVHDRMPVILNPQDYETWLDPTLHDPDRLQSLLHPYPATAMEAFAVSSAVNRPSHDAPDCIQPIAADLNSD